jgi:hypothetical protein
MLVTKQLQATAQRGLIPDVSSVNVCWDVTELRETSMSS